ncbi:MAG: hypothetical protein NTY30_05060 [Candidatus Berkelbacteria bacterium]|nr:hypothetical protein [Candidatus Berkelbacteria bacterium]
MAVDTNKKIDLIVLLTLPIVLSLVALFLNLNAFWSVILFFGLPSILLSFRRPAYILKSLLFSIIASVPVIIIVDYIAESTGQWLIPGSILPTRLFGVVPIEVIFWAIMNFYAVIMYYEWFLDHHLKKELFGKNIKKLLLLIGVLFSTFIALVFYFPNILNISYFYLWFGLLVIIFPILWELINHPGIVPRFIKAAAYFFYLTFFYEVTALKLNWWNFPSNKFVGWVEVSSVRFPIEELVFWIILFTMAILTAFEVFDKDQGLSDY